MPFLRALQAPTALTPVWDTTGAGLSRSAIPEIAVEGLCTTRFTAEVPVLRTIRGIAAEVPVLSLPK